MKKLIYNDGVIPLHPSMEDYLQTFITTQPDWHPNTQQWYEIRLHRFFEWCEQKHILNIIPITATYLSQYLNDLRMQKLSWSTRNGAYTAITAFSKWLAERGICKNLLANANIKRPRKPRQAPRTIPIVYIQQMIAAARRDPSPFGIRDTAILILLATTGMRRGEITSLTLNDLDLDGGTVHIRGKSDNERIGILLPVAIDAITDWLSVRPAKTQDRTLFISLRPNKTGIHKRMIPDALNDICIKYRDLAQLPPISVSPHKWRHTYATAVSQSGNPWALQALMGHTNMSTTGIYVSPPQAELRRVAGFAPKIK